MNETLKIIEKRYSCRSFNEQKPDKAQLRAITQAGIAAPSGMNRQAWRVIAVTDKQLIDEMDAEGMQVLSMSEDKTVFNRLQERGGKLFYNASCMIVIPIDPEQVSGALMDCGIVCQNIVLAAESLGLNTLICGLCRCAFMGAKAEAFRQRLRFPTGYDFGIAVLIGHSDNEGTPHQPDQSKIIFVD